MNSRARRRWKQQNVGKQNLYLWSGFTKVGISSTICAIKKCISFMSASKSLMNVRHKMEFYGENALVNIAFIWHNILVKWMSVSIQKYKMLFVLTLHDFFTLNKPNFLNFSRNNLRHFHCILYISASHQNINKLMMMMMINLTFMDNHATCFVCNLASLFLL